MPRRNILHFLSSCIPSSSAIEKDDLMYEVCSDLAFFYRCHMFYGRRVLDIPDGKPKWSGINNQSDLIEDSPPDLKRKREETAEETEKEKKVEKGES